MTVTELLQTLYVQTPGAYLNLDGETIRCRLPDTSDRQRLPLARIESVVCIGAVRASTDLLLKCADTGRPVFWLTEFGKPRAALFAADGNHTATRDAQHSAHSNTDARLRIASALVHGKIANMLACLRRASHDATGHDKQALHAAVERIVRTRDADLEPTTQPRQQSRNQILGVEGAATRFYFAGLRHAMHPADGIPTPTRRTHRPATDPVNATLSFAYGLIRSEVHGAIHTAGLDPGIGFLHGDHDGQPSLVLDMMEELRPTADRLVLRLFNLKQLRAEHFHTAVSGAVTMTEDGRRTLFTAWHELRSSNTPHTILNRDVSHALIPHVQARLMVRFLAGDTNSYPPYRL